MGKRKEAKKSGGCANIIVVVIAGVVLTFWGLSLLPDISDEADVAQGNNVVVIPSITPVIDSDKENEVVATDIRSALELIESDEITIKQAESFELAQTTQINFEMPNDGDVGRAFIRVALCVARPLVPDGYRVRIVGDDAASMGLISMIVSHASLQSLECPFEGDLASISEEYSEATGLR